MLVGPEYLKHEIARVSDFVIDIEAMDMVVRIATSLLPVPGLEPKNT